MHLNRVLLLIIMLCACAVSHAQSETTAQPDSASLKAAATTDKYLAALDSLRKAYVDWKYQGGDTLSNPYLFQLLSTPTFFSSAANGAFALPADSAAVPANGLTAGVQERTQQINGLLSNLYATQPWLVQRMTPAPGAEEVAAEGAAESATETAATVAAGVAETVVPAAEVATPAAPEVFLGDMDAFHIKVKRPNFWKVLGNFNVQLQQTYISENWYKGGKNNYAANGQFSIEANYNNKKKLAWDNKLEARLGFQTTEEYNVLTFRPTNDLLRLTSKLGVQANKHWFYTLALQAWTQMMPSLDYYDSSNPKNYHVKSDFMSPFEGVLSLGMDYKLEKKRFKTTVNIAPLALNYKHVSRSHDHMAAGPDWFPSKFGLKDGKHNDWKFGSTLTAVASWAICKQVTWDGRLYFFTDYKQHGVKSVNDTDTNFGATVEFENTFTLKINKYLSTRLFLYPRFDTIIPKMKKLDKDGNQVGYHSYLQFKEFLSFGLDISF